MTDQRSAFDVRRAGVLLHVTSLPGPRERDLRPLGARPTGSSTSSPPPAARSGRCCRWCRRTRRAARRTTRSSAMAGNPALISRDRQSAEASTTRRHWTSSSGPTSPSWCAEQARLARAVRRVHAPCASCTTTLRGRRGSRRCGTATRRASREVLAPHADRVQALRFEQWVFAEQWAALRAYAAEQGVLLFGDLPIFVSHDSADVWASRELFQLDARGPADHRDRRAARLLRRGRPALEQPALRLGRDGRRRVRLVAAPDRPPAGAVRPRPHRPLPRLRGGLARARRGRPTAKDGCWVPEPGSRGPRRAGRHRRARARWSRRTSA